MKMSKPIRRKISIMIFSIFTLSITPSIITLIAHMTYLQDVMQSKFEFSELDIEPREVQKGLSVTVKVNVTNVGDKEGTITIPLKIDGKRCGLIELTLLAGESNTAHFQIEDVYLRRPGRHRVEVSGIEDDFIVFTNQINPNSKWYMYFIIFISLTLIVSLLRFRMLSRAQSDRPVCFHTNDN